MKRIILAIVALLISTSAWANVPNATPLYNQYSCNSSTTQFSYSFQITASSDMTAYLTDTTGTTTQLSSSVFSVDTTNLWVNYPLVGSPCPTGDTLTLRPSTPQTQTTTYGARTPFTATAVGNSFDKLTLISQQLQGQINRTFLQPANVTTQVTFPSSSAGSLIGWNGSGVLANINNPAAVAQWSLSGADISYNTGNVSTTNNLSSATITTTGNVGIGTSTTGSSKFQVRTATNKNFLVGSSNLLSDGIAVSSVNDANGSNLGYEVRGSTIQLSAIGANPIQFYANGSQRAVITSGGNVGIGSLTPGQILDITGTTRSTTFSGNGTIPIGGIIMWSGSIATIPTGWALCNGTNGTPDLRNVFVVGANADSGGVAKSTITGSALQTGGSVTIAAANLPAAGLTVTTRTSPTGTGSGDITLSDNTGSGSSKTILGGSGTAYTQPFYALAYIQRTS